MDDAEIVARVLDGDSRAFALIVDRYYESCCRFARRMLGNRDDAEDAVQESFLRAYRSLVRYRERARFRAWLYRIVANQCRSAASRQRRARARISEGARPEDAAVEGDERAGDLRDALQRGLEGLEPPLREAVLLKLGEGLEYSEIAAITGASVPALKMRVLRAREILRGALGTDLNG